ncbi:hypothetical protein ACFQS3_08650 [Glycomyces mayteni]|uniref:Uncharacterized protein n=1 Tax=Glycomyces mayteni TaxID=543887 RepID=A0ABW2D6Z4_9ACTN
MFNRGHGPEGRNGKRRFAIPDTPLVSAVTAAVTLALAVVLFLTAMPGEERVLYYEGERVSPSALCETTGPDGTAVMGACAELGEWETRETGWGVVRLVIAGVLAAGAAVVIAGIPKQVAERRREELAALERLTDEDFPRR